MVAYTKKYITVYTHTHTHTHTHTRTVIVEYDTGKLEDGELKSRCAFVFGVSIYSSIFVCVLCVCERERVGLRVCVCEYVCVFPVPPVHVCAACVGGSEREN